jgi:hypothetical protein
MKATPDFNDIHRTNGPDAARDAFDAAVTRARANGGDGEATTAQFVLFDKIDNTPKEWLVDGILVPAN